MAGTESPVLIVSGFDDEFIFHKTSEKYSENIKSVEHKNLMDADHYFSSPESGEEVVRLVTNFLGKILLGLEEEPSEDEPTAPVEKIESSSAPPLAAQIENTETASPIEEQEETINGSEVKIKEKLPPGATEKEPEKPEKEKE